MTFKDVTIKNFRSNIRRYFSYFLCSTFSIMTFFIYATLLFNDAINEKTKENQIILIFILSIAALTVFSVFFINYAHSSFIKSRNKEFGIYMSLGMTNKDLKKIILGENIIICLSSIITGLAVGTVVSKIFQETAINLLKLEGVKYSLNYKSFILTLLVFILIFIVAQVITNIKISKLDIAQLIKGSRKIDGGFNKNDYKFGILGVILVVASIVMLFGIARSEKLNAYPPIIIAYVLISFTGIYLVIANLGNTIISLTKRSEFYYKNILTITEINYKFNRNKKIIFILSILSSMTIFLVASPYSLYKMSESVAERNIYNIEFVSLGGMNNIDGGQLGKIIGNSSTKLKDKKESEFINLYFDLEASKYDLLKSKPIISEEEYNLLTGKNIKVKSGELINIVTTWEPGTQGINPGDTINFTDRVQSFTFKVKDSYHGDWIYSVGSYPTSSGGIISNEDYTNIKNKVKSNSIGKYYGLNFESWKNTSDTVASLKTEFGKINKDDSSKLFPLVSTIDTYNELKKNYSLFVFVTLLIGILFFVAGGMVLYFKQYTELSQSEDLFKKLYKIGISKKEVKSVISKELLITFFTPLIMGSVYGYCFIYLITNIVSGSDVIGEFMKNTTQVVVVYFIFQLGFYIVTKKKYSDEIIKKL
ncbi:ABC transporter permease [Clostridium estertheticum]|uniref:ABC transporter permease n=1 Tax=Clostridium estertheticum TaxID=238834 RepID=UPI0013EE62B2|nr:ABC transporter permease [Clostridium estertheticum]MBZ9609056.1 ABC transporter permease [Clostridium estertheticum]